MLSKTGRVAVFLLLLAGGVFGLSAKERAHLQRDIAVLESEGRWEECLMALQDYGRLAGAAAATEPAFYRHLGNCYFHLGDPARARANFEKSALLDPRQWQSPFYLGAIAAREKDFGLAVAWLERALAAGSLTRSSDFLMVKFALTVARAEWFQRGDSPQTREEVLAALDEMEDYIVANADACDVKVRKRERRGAVTGALYLAELYEIRRELEPAAGDAGAK